MASDNRPRLRIEFDVEHVEALLHVNGESTGTEVAIRPVGLDEDRRRGRAVKEFRRRASCPSAPRLPCCDRFRCQFDVDHVFSRLDSLLQGRVRVVFGGDRLHDLLDHRSGRGR